MADTQPIVIGLDLGTSGVRAVAAAPDGRILAASSGDLTGALVQDQEGIHEQNPDVWWQQSAVVLRQVVGKLREGGIATEAVHGLAVDGTSGTLVCLAADASALRPAIMYNDARAKAEADTLNSMATAFCERLGYRFAASYALAKIVWIREHEPDVFERTASFAHQADFIATRLVGTPVATDYSNALKTGYDLLDECWPEWLQSLSGVLPRLPPVVAPGQVLGQMSPQAAEATGLQPRLPVVSGATDGTAACLASGVRRPGDFNTTLGTTLVFKTVSEHLVRHPDGLLYSHKLPGGRWLPGAASNTGGEWIGQVFPGQEPADLDAAAAIRVPVDVLAYPLARQGERFPFLAPEAHGLFPDAALDAGTRYAACLQGIALVERLAYELLEDTAGTSAGEVFSAGGGARSDVWTQIRADVTQRLYHRPACPESAFGGAVLAAAGTVHKGLWESIRAMVHVERSFEPTPANKSAYDALYGKLRDYLRAQGWL